MTDSSRDIMERKEPHISVRLWTDGAPLLSPRGEYDICPSEDGVLYTPLNDKSSMVLENLAIGLGFHWQSTCRAVMEGSFKVSKDPEGGWITLNILPLERYLDSVCGSEMNPLAPPEFIKAHAVISRGWALGKMLGRHEDSSSEKIHEPDRIVTWEDSDDHSGFDVCSDDHCQRYQGISEGSGAVIEAVNATRGLVLTSRDGNIADTRFSKCYGGHTELFSTCWQNTDPTYLTAHPDPYCDLTTISADMKERLLREAFKNYDRAAGALTQWSQEVTGESIRRRVLETYGIDTGNILELMPLHRGPSGRIDLLEIRGDRNSLTLGKELAIRRVLDRNCLMSSRFDVLHKGDTFTLTGHGWGHGVGLCQTGAARMAMEGADFRTILSFYYPTAELTQIYD